MTAKYIFGPDTDEPLLMIKTLNPGSNKQQTQRYYYLKDGFGSVAALTNSQGRIVESYAYDEYGRPLSGSLSGNRYLFTAREYDKETGLYYYRARYYDPKIGRFLTQDPIGYAGGMNLYAYCLNSPINLKDPFGLKAYSEEETRRIIKEAVKDAGHGPVDYFTKPPDIFGGRGKYDFAVNERYSTFVVNGETMSSGQFGNYLAGYTSVRNYGNPGYYGVRLGGDMYGITRHDGHKLRWENGTWVIDSPESIKYINKGATDAYRDLLLGKEEYNNIKKGCNK